MGLQEVNSKYKGFPSRKLRRGIPVLVVGLIFLGIAGLLVSSGPAPTGFVILVNQTNSTNTTNSTADADVDNDTTEDALGPKPDLVVTELDFDGDLAFGRSGIIRAKVVNRGNEAADPFEMEIIVDAEVIDTTVIPGLVVGGEREITAVWNYAPPVDAMTIRAVADRKDDLEENSEENNAREITREQSLVIPGGNLTKFKLSFSDFWVSDRYFEVPDVGEYFSLSQVSGDTYYLDVGVAGFKVETVNGIAAIFIPIGEELWSGSETIFENAVEGRGVWNGPIIKMGVSIDKNHNLVVTDQYGQEKKFYVGKDYITISNIELVGAKQSEFPGELLPYRPPNPADIDGFVPAQIALTGTGSIFFYPLSWNPETKEARAFMAAQFKIRVV